MQSHILYQTDAFRLSAPSGYAIEGLEIIRIRDGESVFLQLPSEIEYWVWQSDARPSAILDDAFNQDCEDLFE